MKTRRILVVLIVGGQLLLMLTLIARQEYRLHTWRPIRLRVKPLDPEALFRGRYVHLTYDFSRLETTQSDWEKGDTVYVQLTPDKQGLWQLSGFQRQRGQQPGSVYLRGRVDYIYPDTERVGEGKDATWRRTGRYHLYVRTEIESYFMSERPAPQLEQLPRDKYEMTAEVVVANDGHAALKQLYVRGIPAEKFTP